jgi:hypothetical protein
MAAVLGVALADYRMYAGETDVERCSEGPYVLARE